MSNIDFSIQLHMSLEPALSVTNKPSLDCAFFGGAV